MGIERFLFTLFLPLLCAVSFVYWCKSFDKDGMTFLDYMILGLLWTFSLIILIVETNT